MNSGRQPEGASRPLLQVLSDSVNVWSERALFVLMLLMIGVTTAQVVFRFFFQALTWSEELSCFLLVLASLLGAAVAFKRGSHIAVTFVTQKLSGGMRKSLAVLVNLLGILFFGIVVFYGGLLMKTEAGQTTPAMMISMAWVYAIYPVLGAVVILHLVAGLGEIFGGGRS